MLRALRALPSTSRRLNSNVLHKAISGFFTSNPTTRDFLLAFLEEVGPLLVMAEIVELLLQSWVVICYSIVLDTIYQVN